MRSVCAYECVRENERGWRVSGRTCALLYEITVKYRKLIDVFDILATSGPYRCPRLMRLLPATETNPPLYLYRRYKLYTRFSVFVCLFFVKYSLFVLFVRNRFSIVCQSCQSFTRYVTTKNSAGRNYCFFFLDNVILIVLPPSYIVSVRNCMRFILKLIVVCVFDHQSSCRVGASSIMFLFVQLEYSNDTQVVTSFFYKLSIQSTVVSDAVTTATSVPASNDAKTTVAQSTTPIATHQHSIIPTALSRISEDSPKPTAPHRCLNIAGIEKYPDLQGALPRAWSVPALAPHVRAYLEAPLVRTIFINLMLRFLQQF